MGRKLKVASISGITFALKEKCTVSEDVDKNISKKSLVYKKNIQNRFLKLYPVIEKIHT